MKHYLCVSYLGIIKTDSVKQTRVITLYDFINFLLVVVICMLSKHENLDFSLHYQEEMLPILW